MKKQFILFSHWLLKSPVNIVGFRGQDRDALVIGCRAKVQGFRVPFCEGVTERILGLRGFKAVDLPGWLSKLWPLFGYPKY